MQDTLLQPSFDLRTFYDEEWTEHLSVVNNTMKALYPSFHEWVNACALALTNHKKLLFFGNGGSAADSQHLATEFTVRFKANRKALAAIALTTDSSTLTAIGNDFGFEYLFSRQIEAIGNEGDIAIGISTSGKSPNVINALKTARKMGLITVGLTGGMGGELASVTDILLCVPSQTTSRIQEMHITLGQMLCGAIEYKLGVTA